MLLIISDAFDPGRCFIKIDADGLPSVLEDM
jgi:hypothetical protein